MGKPSHRDLYLNFKDITLLLDGSDSSTVVTQPVPSGLSIRGALIWLVHLVECSVPQTNVSFTAKVALSTVSELLAVPNIGDRGCLFRFDWGAYLATEGMHGFFYPLQLRYFPPVPIAAPELTLYAATGADVASLQGKPLQMRLGFTTAPLDAAAYTEIAETWGY